MNGFFALTIGNNVVSQQINPLYISYHIHNRDPPVRPWMMEKISEYRYSSTMINKDTIQNLIKFQPIGCRDISTQIELEKHGIKAYFSGCITLTLDIDYSVKDSERSNEIIFIDYQLGNMKKLIIILNY